MQSSLGRKIAMVLVLVGGALYFLFSRESDAGTGLTMIDVGDAAAAPEGGGTPVELPVDNARALNEPVDPSAPSKDGIVLVTGNVLDLEQRPLADVTVERVHAYLPASRARTDAAGHFEMRLDEAHGELTAAGDEWMVLGGNRHLLDDMLDGYQLVVAPRTYWSGNAVDKTGRPISDVLVHVITPGDALVPFGLVAPPIDHESQRGWSDPSGRFKVGPVPRVRGSRIEASRAGYSTTTIQLPDDPSQTVRVVLEAER